MVKTSHLSKKRKQILNEILENWKTAELVDIREFKDDYIHFVFRLPYEDDKLDFIEMSVNIIGKYYKRLSNRGKIDIRLTA